MLVQIPNFYLQARSVRESDIIGREGPVTVSQPGKVRAPSGLVTGVTTTATPANKGTQPLKSPSSTSLSLLLDFYFFFLKYCLLPNRPASSSSSCRATRCFVGRTGWHHQAARWGGVGRGASVRCSQEGSPPPQIHRWWLRPAQDARERQLRKGTHGKRSN